MSSDYFTDRARKVLQMATKEAHRLQHDSIGTEHILLGLVSDGTGLVAKLRKELGVNLGEIRIAVEDQIPKGSDAQNLGKLLILPAAKKVIEYAMEEARAMEFGGSDAEEHATHPPVEPEHLLLGLLREQDSASANVLRDFGLRLEVVRDEVIRSLGSDGEES